MRTAIFCLMLPAVVGAQLLCRCMEMHSTLVATAESAGHPCCGESNTPPAEPQHDANCAHCGGKAQSTISERVVATALPPVAIDLPMVLAGASHLAIIESVHSCIPSSTGSTVSPISILQASCVLLI